MRCWCLVLQTLTLCCNHTPHDPAPPTAADQYDSIDMVSHRYTQFFTYMLFCNTYCRKVYFVYSFTIIYILL